MRSTFPYYWFLHDCSSSLGDPGSSGERRWFFHHFWGSSRSEIYCNQPSSTWTHRTSVLLVICISTPPPPSYTIALQACRTKQCLAQSRFSEMFYERRNGWMDGWIDWDTESVSKWRNACSRVIYLGHSHFLLTEQWAWHRVNQLSMQGNV